MTITVTITSDMIGAVLTYLLIGILLYVPLNHWAARHISPRRRGLEVWQNIRPRYVLPGIIFSAGIWPLMIGVLLRDEVKRWRRTHCKGCCSTCGGTGGSGDPETNGRCWDCRGTGHQHWV